MEFPLCTFDLKTGIFCSRCREKIRQGLYDEFDIKVMRLLLELEKRFPRLQKAGYVKAVDGKETILIVLKEGSLREVRFKDLASLRRILSEKLGKHVRIVEDSSDVVRFIEGVITPARIVAVNKIWLPDGSEEMRVILDSRRNLKVGVNSLIEVVKKVKGVKLSVDFERGWRRVEVKRPRKVKEKSSIG
ncbi:MAG: hypothetical protein J7J28_06120 [Thaumarchaeota archaeon]|nr:hypothetical protein [Nitrososphaerota archaeon]